MFAGFLRDRYFLLKYYLNNFVILGCCSIAIQFSCGRLNDFHLVWLWLGGLLLFALPNFSLIFWSGLYFVVLFLIAETSSPSLWVLSLVPVGVICGTVSAAFMHNAAHGNFYPKWSNRIWGELCGLFQLSGFAGWTISHLIHHGNPDDPEKDAHPPGTLTFRQYVNAMGVLMKNNITNKYFDVMGRTQETQNIWSTITFFLLINRYLRVLVVMFILGPVSFVFFYVPFKIANALIYADFNYRTHRPNPNRDGDYEALNLNHNLWFKFLNAISFGSYFHKNHHRKPNAFNPKNVTTGVDVPLITYSMSRQSTTSTMKVTVSA